LYSNKFTHRVTVLSELGDVVTPWPEILLDYARALDCNTAAIGPSFVPTASDVDEGNALLQRLGVTTYLIVHPTNAQAVKGVAWPTQAWATLATALAKKFDLPVLLSGSKGDAAINAETASHANDPRIIDIAGQSGIGAFGAVAQRARAFVGITTGTMHVAAAVGTPTVGIFPFQSDVPDRWGPRGRSVAVVRATYRCHPGDTKESCPDFACIANLNVPRIVSAVETLLSSNTN
jgi:ADP-heptose:LPS heptosyltransferase